MCKARLIGLRSGENRFVQTLHELGIVQLKEFSEPEVKKEYSQEHFALVAEELLKIESALKLLPPSEIKKTRELVDYWKAIREAKKIGFHERLLKIMEKKERLLSQKQLLFESEQKLKLFKRFGIDFSFFSKSEAIEVAAARLSQKNFLHFENLLSEQGVVFDAAEKEAGKVEVIALVAFEKTAGEKVKAALDASQALIEPLPEISGKPQDAQKKIAEQLIGVEKELSLVEKELAGFSEKYHSSMVFLRDVLENESQRAQATAKFGKIEDFFVMECYLAEKNFEGFRSAVEAKFPGRVVFEKFSGKDLHLEANEVPTILDNPGQLSAFEFMTRFVSMPLSVDIDPTIIYALVFPFIYGMMLGDVGYGLLSIAIALAIKKFSAKEGMLYPISKIWALAAIPSMCFGIIFDEYFGFTHVELLKKFGVQIAPVYHGLGRVENIQAMLGLTIAVGFFVILFGFLLGFLREWREEKKAHAIAKLAWMAVLVFGAGMLLSVANHAGGIALAVTGIGFFAALLVIVKTEGVIGLVELPSVASNVLSFARILAVGLASVVVAVTLNNLAFPSPEKGLLLLVILPIYLFGHAFNTFLGMFEGLIQGSRLNFVEFYSKFYLGGGKEFSPFKIMRSNQKRR